MKKKFKRVLVRVAYRLLKIWWFLTRPHTKGVKCLLVHDGKFLLVRLAYGHRKWSVPGGGVHKNETCREAAVREITEEVNVSITNPVYFGEYQQIVDYKNDTVKCYYVEVTNTEFTIDEVEIVEAGWFTKNNFPANRRPSVEKILKLYESTKN